MTAFVYPALVRVDEDSRFVVRFPDLPEAVTDGGTRGETYKQAVDCLGSAIAFRMRDKADVPPPFVPKGGQLMMPVPLWTHRNWRFTAACVRLESPTPNWRVV